MFQNQYFLCSYSSVNLISENPQVGVLSSFQRRLCINTHRNFFCILLPLLHFYHILTTHPEELSSVFPFILLTTTLNGWPLLCVMSQYSFLFYIFSLELMKWKAPIKTERPRGASRGRCRCRQASSCRDSRRDSTPRRCTSNRPETRGESL